MLLPALPPPSWGAAAPGLTSDRLLCFLFRLLRVPPTAAQPGPSRAICIQASLSHPTLIPLILVPSFHSSWSSPCRIPRSTPSQAPLSGDSKPSFLHFHPACFICHIVFHATSSSMQPLHARPAHAPSHAFAIATSITPRKSILHPSVCIPVRTTPCQFMRCKRSIDRGSPSSNGGRGPSQKQPYPRGSAGRSSFSPPSLHPAPPRGALTRACRCRHEAADSPCGQLTGGSPLGSKQGGGGGWGRHVIINHACGSVHSRAGAVAGLLQGWRVGRVGHGVAALLQVNTKGRHRMFNSEDGRDGWGVRACRAYVHAGHLRVEYWQREG